MNNSPVSTMQLYEELSKIIEFPNHVTALTLRMDSPDSIPTIECTYAPVLKVVDDEIPYTTTLFSLVENGERFIVNPKKELKWEIFDLNVSIANNRTKLIEAKSNIWPYH